MGKVFEICVEKGSEIQEGNPLRKFKGHPRSNCASGKQRET